MNESTQASENAHNEETEYIDAALVSTYLPSVLEPVGVLYFILSAIAALYFWLNSNIKTQTGLYTSSVETNTMIVAAGFACILSGLLVMMIFRGIARIIKQNNYMILNH